jgi:hypothetical protein
LRDGCHDGLGDRVDEGSERGRRLALAIDVWLERAFETAFSHVACQLRTMLGQSHLGERIEWVHRSSVGHRAIDGGVASGHLLLLPSAS